MKNANLLTFGALAIGSAVWWACGTSSDPTPFSFPAVATVASPKLLLTTTTGVKVYKGGFGSALARDPKDASIFYLLTDRGPTIDGGVSDSKVFLVPSFTPQLGKFKLEGDSLRLLQAIELKDATGKALTGLPNPPTPGGTAETAVDGQGKNLGTDPNGLDPEGLVVLNDGTFWVADEYGPHWVHFDASGRTMERIHPFGTGKVLPKVLARRRVGRGTEGLTVTPDGKTLVGILQSPLYNPNRTAVSASRVVRLVAMDIATGATRQFVYLLDHTNLQVSEIAALTNETFLVLERDENQLQAGITPVKLIYRISLGDATDVSDPANTAAGRLVIGKTIDQLTPEEMQANGVKPVQKTLAVDIMKAIPTYAHDKAEGMVVLSPTLIALSNDDDFGVSEKNKQLIQKINPFTSQMDRNRVYFIKLDSPLK